MFELALQFDGISFRKCADARGSWPLLTISWNFRIFYGVAPTKMCKKSWNRTDPRASVHFLWNHRKMRRRSRILTISWFFAHFCRGYPTKNLQISWNRQYPRASAHFRAENLSILLHFAFQNRVKIDFEQLYSILMSNKIWKMSWYSAKTAHLYRKKSWYSGKMARYSEKMPWYSRDTLVKLSWYNFYN